MLDMNLSEIEDQLKQAIGAQSLRTFGEGSGFVIREREITADRFVSSMVKSLGSRSVESIADLVRDFNHDHGVAVHYKPYYQKLSTSCFPRLMHAVFESMLTYLYVEALAPLRNGPFARFRDILIQDGTSFALHDSLSAAFKGRFTAVSPAAVELHCTMSLFTDTLVSVTMTGDAECERHHLPDPKDLKDILLLGDRGYDSTEYMVAVDDAGGSYLIRIRKCHDPFVAKIHRRGKRYRDLEGYRLSYVLKRVGKDKLVDMDICWERPKKQVAFSRVVARWNSVDKEWVRLMTNLDRDEFTVEDILQAYRLRWQIELLFKELKSYANLHRYSTTKEPIAEGLIWASFCAAFLKRYLAHTCQQMLGGIAISTRRVAMCGHQILGGVCGALVRGARGLGNALRSAFRFLAHNARRTNPRREKTTGRLALGLRTAGAKA